MSRLVLDSGPLGMACHPRMAPEFRDWLAEHIVGRTEIFLAEIVDYELRRELLRAGKTRSIQRLDGLKMHWRYLPITTDVMLDAAALWAAARQRGLPTAASTSLDIDVILAAQARRADAIVTTTNVAHMERFVEAKLWQDLQPPK